MHDIYGVGPLSSLALCAWLGGADRFSSSRKAVRFVGLDITVHSSDGKRSPGRLSRQGPEVLRWLLFEAAKTSARARAPRLRLLHPGQRPLRREPGLPVPGPTHRPARHPHPDRPRRRRLHRPRPTGRTHHHRPLNRTRGLHRRGPASPTSIDDGTNRGQLPQCTVRPHHHRRPGGDRGRPNENERSHPTRGATRSIIMSRTRTDRPSAIGKSGCHLATTLTDHASEQSTALGGANRKNRTRPPELAQPYAASRSNTARTTQTTTKIALDNKHSCR
jgi:hypothetical protein